MLFKSFANIDASVPFVFVVKRSEVVVTPLVVKTGTFLIVSHRETRACTASR